MLFLQNHLALKLLTPCSLIPLFFFLSLIKVKNRMPKKSRAYGDVIRAKIVSVMVKAEFFLALLVAVLNPV